LPAPGPAYVQFDTGGRDAAEFAGCFSTADSTATFGQDAPVYLEVPFAPSYDFLVEGPLFTSLLLPYAGDNALLEGLIDVLLFDSGLDDYVFFDHLGLGDQLFFPGDGVDRFRLAGLDLPYFLARPRPGHRRRQPAARLRLHLQRAGHHRHRARRRLPCRRAEPATWALMLAGVFLLRHRLRRPAAAPRAEAGSA